MSKDKDTDCRHKDYCKCTNSTKKESCEKCRWYWFIDSGYGFCKSLPTVIVVPWCKDICGLYGEKK